MNDLLGLEKDNPYAPPQAESQPVCMFRWNPDAKGLLAECVIRGWMHRIVRFQGEYEGVVSWDGSGPSESVSVDGRVVAGKLNLSLWNAIVPRFDIPVDVGYPATMTVEIRILLMFFHQAFRIRLDGRTLYSEGDWSDEPLPTKPR